LGRWVLRAACEQFSQWRAQGIGENAILRVNVSPVQLVTAGFVESVAEAIADFGLDGKSVCLEITESVVVQDIETTRITLAGLKQVGVQVAIDDFGTGYSVLTHLKSLPVDTLKIDKSFVFDLGSDPGDLAIVRAVIALAEAFGLELVAEGVESPAAARKLLEHGCHRAQGYLLSRPLPADQMAVAQVALHRPRRIGGRRTRGQDHSGPRPYQSAPRRGGDGGTGHPSPFEDQPLQTPAVPGEVPLPRLLGQPVGQRGTRTVGVGAVGPEHGSADELARVAAHGGDAGLGYAAVDHTEGRDHAAGGPIPQPGPDERLDSRAPIGSGWNRHGVHDRQLESGGRPVERTQILGHGREVGHRVGVGQPRRRNSLGQFDAEPEVGAHDGLGQRAGTGAGAHDVDDVVPAQFGRRPDLVVHVVKDPSTRRHFG
jgi:EAL domain-containing protein (putative c-di-GMP-specific phosphodiesterase class I)